MRRIGRHIEMLAIIFGFLLGVKGDYLALWSEDDPQPIHIFSCRISALPPADQILLRKGLQADSTQQLMQYLEDYL